MKKLSPLTLILLLTFAVGTAARAQVVGVQFVGGSNAPLTGSFYNFTAGYDPQENWNPEVNTGNTTSPQSVTVTGLMDSTGAATTVGFTLAASGAYYTGAGTNFPTPNFPTQTSGQADGFLYAGFAYADYTDSNPLVLTITGLNPTDNYELLTYVSPFEGFGGNQAATLSIVGGPTYSFDTDGAAGTYEAISATGMSTGNYIETDGLVGATQTLTLSSSGLVGISGFQIIDTGSLATPEPSTYVLVGLGVLGLVMSQRRKLQI